MAFMSGPGQAISTAMRMARRAVGGPAPTYQTAAPAVNAAGYVPVAQPGSYNLDLNTGALTGGTQSALQTMAQRGLPIMGSQPVSVGQNAAAQQQAQQQALQQTLAQEQAAAMNNYGGGGAQKRGGAVHLAAGGLPSGSEMADWATRREAGAMDHPEGFIHSTVPGRTDRIPMSVASGSYVVPADVMAGLGEGNGLAGAHALESALHTGPGGVRLPSGPAHTPHMPGAPRMPKLASGGVAREHGGVPVIVAGGEYLLKPDTVRRIGGGDLKSGHAKLDKWVVDRRRHQVKQIKALPGPVK